MFVLDSFLHWVLTTVTAAAEAELHDDAALREQLLEAEMRRELGEIGDEEFTAIEADLLARIRDITARRQGVSAGTLPAAHSFAREPGTAFRVEASVMGEFHDDHDVPGDTADRDERAGSGERGGPGVRPTRSVHSRPPEPSPSRRRGAPGGAGNRDAGKTGRLAVRSGSVTRVRRRVRAPRS